MAEQQTTQPAAEAAPKTVSGVRAASMTAPGPRSGNVLFGSALALRRDPLGFPLRMALTYGPVVRVRIVSKRTYLIAHPDGVMHVLKTGYRNYDRELGLYHTMRRFFGEGLATSSGKTHLLHRRIMQPPFHRGSLAAFGNLMADAVRDMLDGWQTAASQAGLRLF